MDCEDGCPLGLPFATPQLCGQFSTTGGTVVPCSVDTPEASVQLFVHKQGGKNTSTITELKSGACLTTSSVAPDACER